jgi:hypothetical protein
MHFVCSPHLSQRIVEHQHRKEPWSTQSVGSHTEATKRTLLSQVSSSIDSFGATEGWGKTVPKYIHTDDVQEVKTSKMISMYLHLPFIS